MATSLAALCLSSVLAAAPSTSDRDLARADSLRGALDERGALALYQSVIARDSGNLEALWKASYLASTLGHRNATPDSGMVRLGDQLAAISLRRYPDAADARFVSAVSLALSLPRLAVGERAKASRELRRRIAATLEKDPRHPGAWYLLGRWRLAYASLGTFEAIGVKALLGGIPAEATLAGAETAFRNAIAARPEEPLYHLDLARTLVKEHREADAIRVLAAAQSLKPRSGDDPGTLVKIRKLLAKLREG